MGEAPRITDVLQRSEPRRARGSGETQARLRSLADALPHGMAYQVHVSADRKTRRFTFVAESCPILNGGVTVEQALADSDALYGLIAPDDRRRLQDAETEALETLLPFDVEVQFVLPGGERRWCRLTSSPRKLPDGSTIWEGFQIDITARRSAQTALRESEERRALALDATRLGLWEYDIVTGQLDWNPRIREMYGVGLEEPVDFDTFVSGVHPDDRKRVLAAYGRAAEGGGDFAFEHRLARPDDTERWLLSHGRVLTDKDGKAVRALGTAMDITDRKQAEADNRLLLDELNHRVKNSFATVASLLTLRAKRSRSEEARQQLTEALNQVMSIAQAYAHLYAGGQPRSLDVADYLRDLCNGLADGMIDGERIRLTVRADSATMETDRALPLGMAVNELVTNAIKYAFPDGRSGLIEVTFEAQGDGWRLSIADDGVGLPGDYEQQRGAGAGLVKSFARQAGARFRILDGPGARFEITSV
ncbi:MAG TPA: PAS domain-containing protein [Caulobacteraceae bacterium]|nr:PAS domain-containing protein [Caulobacteraceae bacterium]